MAEASRFIWGSQCEEVRRVAHRYETASNWFQGLSATQRQQLTRNGFFDVICGETGTTYRICESYLLNGECQLTKAPRHVDAPARVEAHRLSVLMNLHAA